MTWWPKRNALLEKVKSRRFSETYQAFTTAFDEETEAAKLLRAASPTDQRIAADHFDALMRQITPELDRVCAALAAPMADLGRAGQSLSILVDHSGSLRKDGQRALMLLAWLGVWRAARQAGVGCDVLGFTTVDWQGKPVRPLWMKLARLPHPGRLCALRHIVYRREEDLAAFCLPDLLRENVDGEALLWAAERADPATVLIVLSDGAPVDDATLSANPAAYLWDHLHEVIAQLEARPGLTLAGVGIGYDLYRTYPRHAAIATMAEAPGALRSVLVDSLEGL